MSIEEIFSQYPELDSFDITELEDMDELELQILIDDFETDTSLPISLRNNLRRIDFSEENRESVKSKYGISDREWLRAENLSIKSQLAEEEARRESFNSGIKALNEGTLSMAEGQVIFATREDDKVCPICEDLDGEIFDVDNRTGIINGPLIPDETHPNCRCRYLTLSGEEI